MSVVSDQKFKAQIAHENPRPLRLIRSYRELNKTGGESGIRTRDTVSRIHTFQACAFNHSATSPLRAMGCAHKVGEL